MIIGLQDQDTRDNRLQFNISVLSFRHWVRHLQLQILHQVKSPEIRLCRGRTLISVGSLVTNLRSSRLQHGIQQLFI